MKKQPANLQIFINAEMRRRHIGVSDFARLVGVGHSQISHHISEKPPTPTLRFLRQLSKGTGVPLTDLLAIAFPEIREELEVDPDADMLARRIMQFPKYTRDTLIRIVESFQQGSNNHKTV